MSLADRTVLALGAMAGIVAIVIAGISAGHDGMLLLSGAVSVAGLGGYEAGRRST